MQKVNKLRVQKFRHGVMWFNFVRKIGDSVVLETSEIYVQKDRLPSCERFDFDSIENVSRYVLELVRR